MSVLERRQAPKVASKQHHQPDDKTPTRSGTHRSNQHTITTARAGSAIGAALAANCPFAAMVDPRLFTIFVSGVAFQASR